MVTVDLKKRIVLTSLIIIFLEQLGSHLYRPDIVRMLDHSQHLLSPELSQHARNWLLGLSGGLGSLVSIYTTPVLGTCSDAWGRKNTIIFIHLLSLISLILPIIGIKYDSFALVILSNCIAVSVCARMIAKASLVDISVGIQRKLYMGIATIAKDSPVIFGPILGAILSNENYGNSFSLATPYYLGIGIIMLNTFVVVFFFKNPTRNGNCKHRIKAGANFFRLIYQIKYEKKFILPALAFGLYEFSFALFNNDVPLFWHEYLHASILRMSEYSAFIALIITLSLIFIYPLWIKYVSSQFQMKLPLFIITICVIIISFAPNAFERWLLTIPAISSAAMVYPQFLALMTSSVSGEKNGWAMGMIYTIVGIVWSSSSLIMVPLHAVSPHYPLILTGIVSLSSIGVLVLMDKRKEHGFTIS